MKLERLLEKGLKLFEDYMPQILTGTSILGVALTAWQSYRMAKRIIEDRPETPVEWVKTVAPTALCGTATTVSILGINYSYSKRLAALASLYAISKADNEKLKEEAAKLLGKEKVKEVTRKVDRDSVVSAVDTSRITKVRDEFLGIMFEASLEEILRAENEMNKMLLNEGCATLQDFYSFVDRDINCGSIASHIKWRAEDYPPFELDINADLFGGKPVMTISYDTHDLYI